MISINTLSIVYPEQDLCVLPFINFKKTWKPVKDLQHDDRSYCRVKPCGGKGNKGQITLSSNRSLRGNHSQHQGLINSLVRQSIAQNVTPWVHVPSLWTTHILTFNFKWKRMKNCLIVYKLYKNMALFILNINGFINLRKKW